MQAARQDASLPTMTKMLIAILVVAALLIGGLMQLLKNRNQSMGSPEVLERVRQRERELREQEARENDGGTG